MQCHMTVVCNVVFMDKEAVLQPGSVTIQIQGLVSGLSDYVSSIIHSFIYCYNT